jgi:type II secretory pathway pseudopilin PulG
MKVMEARHRFRSRGGFAMPDLLVVLAVICMLVALLTPAIVSVRGKTKLSQCNANLGQVSRAILMYADENQKTFPILNPSPPTGVWWWYKEQVKRYAGLQGKSSPNDKVFACPDDRGYEDSPTPFCKSAKFDYGSYCFNGINLPGVPNIAGKEAASIRDPRHTLLVMEWTAHAPLSWHKSKTGKANSPFYNDAESVVGFVDGHVSVIKVYYDGMNAAYTRDPLPSYEYKYSSD